MRKEYSGLMKINLLWNWLEFMKLRWDPLREKRPNTIPYIPVYSLHVPIYGSNLSEYGKLRERIQAFFTQWSEPYLDLVRYLVRRVIVHRNDIIYVGTIPLYWLLTSRANILNTPRFNFCYIKYFTAKLYINFGKLFDVKL